MFLSISSDSFNGSENLVVISSVNSQSAFVFSEDQDVKLLVEEELSIYIPQYGDGIFAKNWRDLSSSEMEDTEQRKK